MNFNGLLMGYQSYILVISSFMFGCLRILRRYLKYMNGYHHTYNGLSLFIYGMSHHWSSFTNGFLRTYSVYLRSYSGYQVSYSGYHISYYGIHRFCHGFHVLYHSASSYMLWYIIVFFTVILVHVWLSLFISRLLCYNSWLSSNIIQFSSYMF